MHLQNRRELQSKNAISETSSLSGEIYEQLSLYLNTEVNSELLNAVDSFNLTELAFTADRRQQVFRIVDLYILFKDNFVTEDCFKRRDLLADILLQSDKKHKTAFLNVLAEYFEFDVTRSVRRVDKDSIKIFTDFARDLGFQAAGYIVSSIILLEDRKISHIIEKPIEYFIGLSLEVRSIFSVSATTAFFKALFSYVRACGSNFEAKQIFEVVSQFKAVDPNNAAIILDTLVAYYDDPRRFKKLCEMQPLLSWFGALAQSLSGVHSKLVFGKLRKLIGDPNSNISAKEVCLHCEHAIFQKRHAVTAIDFLSAFRTVLDEELNRTDLLNLSAQFFRSYKGYFSDSANLLAAIYKTDSIFGESRNLARIWRNYSVASLAIKNNPVLKRFCGTSHSEVHVLAALSAISADQSMFADILKELAQLTCAKPQQSNYLLGLQAAAAKVKESVQEECDLRALEFISCLLWNSSDKEKGAENIFFIKCLAIIGEMPEQKRNFLSASAWSALEPLLAMERTIKSLNRIESPASAFMVGFEVEMRNDEDSEYRSNPLNKDVSIVTLQKLCAPFKERTSCMPRGVYYTLHSNIGLSDEAHDIAYMNLNQLLYLSNLVTMPVSFPERISVLSNNQSSVFITDNKVVKAGNNATWRLENKGWAISELLNPHYMMDFLELVHTILESSTAPENEIMNLILGIENIYKQHDFPLATEFSSRFVPEEIFVRFEHSRAVVERKVHVLFQGYLLAYNV